MRNLILFACLFFTGFAGAQVLNQKAIDPKKNNEMLVGYSNREGFCTVNSNFDSVYRVEYPLYVPDDETIHLIAGKLKGVKITLVMATWCGDSKDWVPRFYKVMDAVNFNYKNLTLICVDREKKAPGTIVESLNIERVPTFIFYHKKSEIGRIIEVPEDLIEKDILKILSR